MNSNSDSDLFSSVIEGVVWNLFLQNICALIDVQHLVWGPAGCMLNILEAYMMETCGCYSLGCGDGVILLALDVYICWLCALLCLTLLLLFCFVFFSFSLFFFVDLFLFYELFGLKWNTFKLERGKKPTLSVFTRTLAKVTYLARGRNRSLCFHLAYNLLLLK